MPSSSERPGTLDAFQTSLSPLCVWVCGVCECECVCGVWVWCLCECVVSVCVCARVKSVKLFQYCRQYNTFQLTIPLVNKPQHTHFLLCRNLAHCLSMSNFNPSIHPNAWGGGRYINAHGPHSTDTQGSSFIVLVAMTTVLYCIHLLSLQIWSDRVVQCHDFLSPFWVITLQWKETELCGLRQCSCSSTLL